MNPWVILAALAALIAAAGIGYVEGYQNGMANQKVADQAEFDKINRQLAEQKAEAASKARVQRDAALAVMAERDKFKSLLGAQHVENQDLTRRLADAYAAYSLRFQTTVEDGWCGDRSGPGGYTGNTASAPRTATIQLPEALARDLRQLARDADELNDEYKLCYGYTYPGVVSNTASRK